MHCDNGACKGIYSLDMLPEGNKACPYCGTQPNPQYISCVHCATEYDAMQFVNCPYCAILDSIRGNTAVTEPITLLDSDEHIKTAIKVLGNKSPAPIVCYTAKYGVFIHLLWQFFKDMEKGLIANNRVSEYKKILWVDAYLGMLYSEGSLLMDYLDEPEACNVEKLNVKFLGENRDDLKTGIKIYNCLSSNPGVLFHTLKKFTTLHRMCYTFIENYMNLYYGKTDTPPITKWAWVVKKSKEIIEKRKFENASY